MTGASSEHFQAWELVCHCCGQNRCTAELVAALEDFRTAAGGKPVIVDDAYRCPAHNKEVGGVLNSQHSLGKAADIRITGMTATELERIARAVPSIHGIGRDDHKDYLHIDVRETPAEWCYGTNGKQVAYYLPTASRQIVS